MKFKPGYCGTAETLHDELFKCKICGFQCDTVNERNKHLKIVHKLLFEQYIIQYYFNKEYPTCKCGCGTKLNFSCHSIGFFKNYTTNHFPRHPHTEETKRQIHDSLEKSMMKKYGVKNPMELKQCRDKIAQSKLERYNNPTYNNMDKNKQTKLERYGDEKYQNIEKIKETNQLKYGANSYTASEIGKKKIKKSNLEKYGVEYPSQLESTKEKIKQTNLIHCGYTSNLLDPAFRKEHNKKTSLIEKEICRIIGAEHKFFINHREFDMIKGNDIFEIDCDFHHPSKLINLSFIPINSVVNDFVKMKDALQAGYNLWKIHISNIPEIVTVNSLKSHSYIPDYSIDYNQKIILAKYFNNYKQKHGEKKLAKYIPLLRKFIKTFQPELPKLPCKENLKEVISKIHNYDLSKMIIDDTKFSNNGSTMGNNYLKSHFNSFWNSNFNGNKTPVEAWKDDKIMYDVIKYRIGLNNSNETFDFSLANLVRGLSARRIIISFFKPLLASSIYYKLLGDSPTPVVFDPCCGFGGRLLGFKSKYPNGTYIGCEPNKDTYKELLQLIKDANFTNCHIYNCKIEEFDLSSIKYDIAFTSIPYFDVEQYSNNMNYESFEQWAKIFVSKILLLKNGYIILPEKLYNQLNLTNSIWGSIHSRKSHFGKIDKQELIIQT
jgi:hypothetical protein